MSGNSCNPNWTPYENMVSSIRGYHIREGNPISESDPGFRIQIFNPTVKNKNGRIELEAGVTSSDLSNCQKSALATTVQSYEAYR